MLARDQLLPVPPTFTIQCLSAGSGHEYRTSAFMPFRFFAQTLTNATILRLPFDFSL